MDNLQEFQRLSKYSRWRYTDHRRESWDETVARLMTQLHDLGGDALTSAQYADLTAAIRARRALPSMRLLAMAGPAFARDNITGYNCAALVMDNVMAFHDLALLGMAGAGVAYSVEQRHISQLPVVAAATGKTRRILVDDSAEGWAAAFAQCIQAAYAGADFESDLSAVRARGAVLKIKGGRASGPAPLRAALNAITRVIRAAAGRQLTPLEVSDVCCHIGSAVVSGGIRRTALMALFDAADAEMTAAKTGDWWQSNPQRANANFSQIITRPAQSLNEMRARLAPMLSPAGEPGFFQRWVAQVRLSGLRARRLNDWQHDNLLCNPCGEAILAPYELCNLSAFVARATDSPDDLLQATRYAAWLGTLQAQGVHFPSLWHAAWTENAKRERLLGVGFLGYADNAHLRGENVLGMCRATVQLENAWLSERLGAPIASASTAVKPAGNSGLFAGAGSGLHPWHYRYMLRRVTLDDHDPLFQMLRAQHAPLEPSQYNAHQWFLRVPLAAPAGALVLSAVDAVQQLRNLESVTAHYTDHAVSVTVGYRAGEEDAIARYIYEHQGNLVGCTFFRCDVVYPQSPITELTESEYHNLIAEFPQIDWTRLAEYEGEDYTTGAAELACAGGQCEIYGGAAPTAAALCQRRRRGANGGGAVPTAVTL